MANILLISYYFPPYNSIPCRRVYGWAKYLHKKGHKVIVLTADAPGDESIKSFNVDTSFLEVHRLKYFDILKVIMKFIKPKAFLNVNKQSAGLPNLIMLGLEKVLTFINKSLSSRGILFGSTRFPAFFEFWFFKASKHGLRIIRERNIDVVITSFPPPAVNFTGYFLKRKIKRILWVADYRDLWVENPAHKGLFPFTILEKYIERKSFAFSSVVIVASKVMQRLWSEKYPYKREDIYCVENGYDEEMMRGLNLKEKVELSPGKTIIYTGTLYQDRRNPENLFKAVACNIESFSRSLKIIFYGNFETRRIIDALSSRYPSAGGILKYGGFLEAREAVLRQNQADVLLFLENDSCDDGVLTGKIFEYIYFRKPILCVGVSENSYVGEVLEKTGLCVFCKNDADSVREYLKRIIENKIQVVPRESYIKEFSRERQVEKVSGIIDKYLGLKLQ